MSEDNEPSAAALAFAQQNVKPGEAVTWHAYALLFDAFAADSLQRYLSARLREDEE